MPIEDQAVRGRAQSVTFPDGRQLIVVGRHHGERNLPNRLFSVIGPAGRSLNATQFINRLDLLLAELNEKHPLYPGTPLEHARSDMGYARELIRRSRIQFIADETTAELMSTVTHQAATGRAMLRAEFARRGLALTDTYRNLEAFSTGLVGPQLRAEDPGLFASVANVAFENPDQIAAEIRADAPMERARETLRGVLHELGEEDQSREFRFQYRSRYNDGETSHAIETLMRTQETGTMQSWPEALRRAAIEFQRTILASIRTTEARDQTIAEAMVARRESGVLFIGRNHLNSIARRLSLLCRREQNRRTGEAAGSGVEP